MEIATLFETAHQLACSDERSANVPDEHSVPSCQCLLSGRTNAQCRSNWLTKSSHFCRPGVLRLLAGLFDRCIPPFHSACFICTYSGRLMLCLRESLTRRFCCIHWTQLIQHVQQCIHSTAVQLYVLTRLCCCPIRICCHSISAALTEEYLRSQSGWSTSQIACCTAHPHKGQHKVQA